MDRPSVACDSGDRGYREARVWPRSFGGRPASFRLRRPRPFPPAADVARPATTVLVTQLPIEFLKLAALLLDVGGAASGRRAVSTAYYALFHLLAEDAAARAARHPALSILLQRRLQHSTMKDVCQRLLAGSKSGRQAWPDGLELPAPSDALREVASAFVELQLLREVADYDPSWHSDLEQLKVPVARAQRAFDAWQSIRATEEADTFLILLMFGWNLAKPPR